MIGDEDRPPKFGKKISTFFALMVTDTQWLEWKIWKTGNMKHSKHSSKIINWVKEGMFLRYKTLNTYYEQNKEKWKEYSRNRYYSKNAETKLLTIKKKIKKGCKGKHEIVTEIFLKNKKNKKRTMQKK